MVKIEAEDVAYIKGLLPEIDLLEPADADRVASIWARTWRESRWEKLEEMGWTEAIKKPSLVEHVRATVLGSVALADVLGPLHQIPIDRQLLILLGLLHDASKPVEYEPAPDGAPQKSKFGKRIAHAFYAAHLAMEQGFSAEVIHLILTHTPQSKMPPATIEGVLFGRVDMADVDVIRTHLVANQPH